MSDAPTEPTGEAGDAPTEPTSEAGDAAAPWPVVGIVRAIRRRADLSQRELARRAGVHHATVGRIEAGRLAPSIELLCRIIGVAGHRLAVVDESGRVRRPMRDWADTRDGAEHRYPSHLDAILDPEPGEWWADITGDASPRSSQRDASRRCTNSATSTLYSHQSRSGR
ncbi:helix-turn-helix transcriptional regulator [Micromonospora avicenniae]|uniref:DNA-binding transcriptional regulator, XRE-family HTH domain n=1 Tax=Micromonospora avicenniae TaxID=1198245 RepID=A0A1N6QIE2_9ACTN|nr:helix-turn-helix transcriptional regulator [Micromonospora avicenniae]SIQ16349.1 DNA-binding transcriptional regulator, XRE-family HTH domain [Micromonospora avicenniae]